MVLAPVFISIIVFSDCHGIFASEDSVVRKATQSNMVTKATSKVKHRLASLSADGGAQISGRIALEETQLDPSVPVFVGSAVLAEDQKRNPLMRSTKDRQDTGVPYAHSKPQTTLDKGIHPKFSHVKLVAVETRKQTPYYALPGVPGTNVTNLGFNEKWSGPATKLRLFSKWLQAQDTSDKLVAMMDGGDVLYGGCDEEQFLANYHKTVRASGGASVVFSAEMRFWPLQSWKKKNYDMPFLLERQSAVLKEFGLTEDSMDHSYQFLNYGFIVGPISDLKKVLHCMAVDEHSDHDQGAAVDCMMNSLTNTVTLDYAGSLSFSLQREQDSGIITIQDGMLRNEVLKQEACFVHGNGANKAFWEKMVSVFSSH